MAANYNFENSQFQTGLAQANNPAAFHVAQEIFNHQLAQAASDTRSFLQGSTNVTAEPFVSSVNQDLKLLEQNNREQGYPGGTDYLTIEPLYGHQGEDVIKMKDIFQHSKTLMEVPAENCSQEQSWSYQPWNSRAWNEQVCPPGYRVPPNYVFGQNGAMQPPDYYNQPNYYNYNYAPVGYSGSYYLPPPTEQYYAPSNFAIPAYQPPIERCGGFYVNRAPESNGDKNWWERALAHTALDLLWRR
jgi:hypothetical protein